MRLDGVGEVADVDRSEDGVEGVEGAAESLKAATATAIHARPNNCFVS